MYLALLPLCVLESLCVYMRAAFCCTQSVAFTAICSSNIMNNNYLLFLNPP
jgi:hypothetical protein